MRARWILVTMVCCWGALSAQEKALVEKNSATPAKQAPGYEVSGTLLNAMTGDPLPKAKVWVVPILDQDQQDDDTAQGGRRAAIAGGGGPGGGRPGGPGGGFGPGGGQGAGPGGGRAFANRGQRGQGQQAEVEPQTEAFTDANGHFAIENVIPGKYTMFAERKGFPRQALERHGGFNTAVVVGEGKETNNIIFRAVPDSGISGRITDDFGDPVPNARVFLFYKTSAETGEDAVRRRGTTGTDTQGNYHFSHLPPGTYFVVVSAQPWYAMYSRMMGMMQAQPQDGTGPQDGDANLDVAFGVTFYSNSSDENNATPITLNAGEHFEADMTMNTTQATHIQVAGQDPKTPMFPNLSTTVFGQEIFLQAMPIMGRPAAEGQPPTMALAVAPGQYTADVRTFGGGGPPTNVRRQTIDTAGGNVTLDVNKGQEPAQLTGTVKFEGTTDTPRGNVLFRKVDGGDAGGGARSNGDGQIETQLYPGKYNVTAGFSHYVIKSMTATGAKVSGRTLEVTGSQPIKFNLVLSKDDARIDGIAHGGDDKPVAGAFVILVPDDMTNNEPLFRRSQTGTDGSFHFGQVIPGKYTVVAIQNNWNVEWAKPNVMQPYLAKGDVIEVGPKAAMKLKVKVQ